MNVDGKSRIPSIITSKALMAKKALKTPNNNNGI